ncbi:MAG: cell division protein ZapA [Moraxella sp.]
MATAESTKKVDILINGRSYTINCPVSEETALQRAASYVNQFVQEVRSQAPQLPQEELLVLCALTLYEKSESLQRHQENEATAQAMIDAMLADVNTLT